MHSAALLQLKDSRRVSVRNVKCKQNFLFVSQKTLQGSFNNSVNVLKA